MTATPPGDAVADDTRDVLDTTDAGPASIRGGAIRVIGYVAGVLVGLIAIPLLIRHLGVSDFGRYVTALSVVTLTTGLTEGGLRDVATREYSTRSGADRDDLMANMLGVRLLLSALGIVLAIAYALIAGYDQAIVLGILVAGVGFLLNGVQIVLTVPLASQLRLVAVTMLELARNVITAALMVAFVVAGLGVASFLAIALFAAVPSLIATAWLVRDRMPLRPRLALDRWRQVARDTLPFAAVTAIAVVYFRLSIIVMSEISTELETGYFATSYRVIEALLFVPSVLVAAVFPVLARAARDDAARFGYAVQKVLDVALIGGTWMVLALAVGAEFVIDVLGGAEAEPATGVLQIQALVLLPAFLIALGGYALLSLHRHRAVLASIGLGLATNGVLLAVLVPPHGAEGAAIATVAGEAVIAVTMIVLLLRSRQAPLSFRTALPVLLAAGLGVSVILVPGLPSVVDAVLASAVYFAVLAALRALPREAIEAFARR